MQKLVVHFSGQARRAGRGHALVWAICCMSVMAGFLSLAIDFGRATATKSELQSVTDAAARSAARTMRSLAGGQSSAAASAAAVFAESKVDGHTPPFDASTGLTLGIWTPGTRTFTPATIAQGANAVKVTGELVLGEGNHTLAVLPLIRGPITVRAECIAMVSGANASTYVSAKSNPWLAGMPDGTKSENLRPNAPHVWDYAGNAPNVASSPGMIGLDSSNISAGQTILFDSVTGTAANDGSSGNFTADGNTGWVVNLGTANGIGANSWPLSVNGISNIKSPINGMIAVFLSDSAPNSTSAPTALDFSTPASRDYQSIAPELKQTFFIGDGRRSNGEAQQIVVPAGATRLFIGNMDAWQWNDNTGGYTATINSVVSVTTVR